MPHTCSSNDPFQMCQANFKVRKNKHVLIVASVMDKQGFWSLK